MKYLIPGFAGAALIAIVAAAAAQTYPMMTPQMLAPNPALVQSTMIDDGSSSDYPIPMPSDISGNALNRQVLQANRQMAAPAPIIAAPAPAPYMTPP